MTQRKRMASTYLSLHYHLVFSTKEREPTIGAEIRPAVHDYLGGTIRGLGGHPRMVGGTADHVHLLVDLLATHILAHSVRELKKASSKWMREKGNIAGFAWQEGYAAFTVSASGMEQVKDYVANQEAHHRERSFLDELRILLRKSGVEFDERYLV